MKRILCLVLLILTLASMAVIPANADESDLAGTTINVYNWGQYISDGTDGSIDVNAEFEKATGIKVNYMTFDSNETLYTKLKTGGSTYDVIIPSDYMIARLAAEGMLLELNFDNIPNYKYVDEAYKNKDFDPENKYSVPYTWGTVGLIYNKKYVEEPTSWEALWDPRYSGKILMFNNPRDSFAIAQFRLGYSINTSDPDEFEKCADLLAEQKPYVQNYVMDQIYDKMIREEAYIAPYYAGDYLMMAEDNPDLGFCFPEEGFNVFVDAMCIPVGAENKAAAEAYINFMCDPEISGKNMDFLGYSTPISAAKQYMDPDTVASEVAYPTSDVLERSMAFSYLDTETTQMMDSLWNDVKTSAGIPVGSLVGIITVFAVVSLWFGFRYLRNKKRIAARYK